MSVLEKLKPTDFQTENHYWDTFGNSETETSALWIVLFLKDRMTSGDVAQNGWAPFKYGDLKAFYNRTRLERSGKPCSESFRFNQLVPGTFIYTSSSSTPPSGLDYAGISTEGIGHHHVCNNDHSILISRVKGAVSTGGDYLPDDMVLVTDKFVTKLASKPHMFVTSP